MLRGTVLRSAGTYIFFDSQVSSPDMHLSTAASVLLLQAIQFHQPVDAFCTVPAIIEDMMKNCTPQDLDSLRAMRSLGVGGAQTSESVFKWAVENDIPYVDVSGATEAVGAICARRAVSPEASQGLRMIPGLEGLLEKEALSDTHGELIVRATVSLTRHHFRLSFLTLLRQHLPIDYSNVSSNAFSYDEEAKVTTYRTGDIYDQKHIQPSLSYIKGETTPKHSASKDTLSGMYTELSKGEDSTDFSQRPVLPRSN